jgi:hypothetical protein
MEEIEFYNKYWYNYLNLEKKIIEYENYVEFNEKNYDTYSRELMQFLFVICSEVDTMLNIITNENTMNNYKTFIINNPNYSNIINEEVKTIIFDELKFKPFIDFNLNFSPSWWKAYNDNKHNRAVQENYEKANLKNVICSLAGLYLLEIYYFNTNYYDENSDSSNTYNIPKGQSKLFKASILISKCVSIDNFEGLLYTIDK